MYLSLIEGEKKKTKENESKRKISVKERKKEKRMTEKVLKSKT